MDIQAETLITLVQERPVLWDKTEDVYKDKNLKLAAWREVCLILKPNFDELDEKERKQYGKQVSTKWNNIRDSWLKTVKKQKDESKSGSSAKKTRNYLYNEQLMFLKKVSEPRPPHESVSKKARTETEVGMESDFRSPLIKDKRKIYNKEVNDRMVKFLDSRINPEKENHHLSFFKGIIPILNTLTIEETLEFQASVMTMLQKIKSRNYERPNYGHWRDSYNQMTGPDQYSGYYTHNSVNQQATPTQDQHHPGYSTQYNSSNQQATTSIPSTSSQTSNPIPASPSASSNHSIHSQDSDYLDFEGI
ncbi:Dihydrouridine synthase domain containing protein [Operophtera brumata]|uniref:Dihydrouridine synthase domain containing protein n=1 Tax=Operophtera brumata TaxID=104452 RepID=A0A0L7KVT9_OPEBR|nr:Dihydrouridine synthase domain containing protein [Operophtera brumata]